MEPSELTTEPRESATPSLHAAATSRARTVGPRPHSGVGLLALLTFAFVALLGRLVWINAADGPRLIASAARQQRSTIPLPARRGMIVDAEGRILAGSRLRQSVFVDAKVIDDRRIAAHALAEILNLGAGELEADLGDIGDKRFHVLARDVTDEQADRIRHANIEGIGLFDDPYRVYPMGPLAAQIIGFVAADGHGVSGVEHQLESWMVGRPGNKTVVRDVRRRAFWLAGDGYLPPRDGLNVVLTLNAVIQENVERLVAKVVQDYQAESAIAVVMRPGNGEILALANYPGFDPNNYPDYAPARYRNRVITDPVEPGSIFKPFIAAGALIERVTRLDEVFDCHAGLFRDGDRLLHDHHPYTLLTFKEIVSKSSNIGMALIGKRLGNERMFKYVQAFGFGKKTGIDLEGEDDGQLNPLHRWNSFTTTSIPMGHEIGVTPIQIARAFCAFANGGRLVRPRIVRAIVEGSESVVRDFTDDEPAPRVISESIAGTVKNQLLVETVNHGTGQNAALIGYQVFGKTGTAQIARHGGGGYIPNAYISSFVGGAPAGAPQLVVLVSVMKPNAAKGYYGGTVAAPVAGDILAHALAYLRIPPEAEQTVATANR